MKKSKRDIGWETEQAACETYLKSGYTLVERNWHCHRMGELDLILRDDARKILVIAEVKYRTDTSFATPAEQVNLRKITTIRRISEIYFASHREYKEYNVRFDVAEVTKDCDGYVTNILEGAF